MKPFSVLLPDGDHPFALEVIRSLGMVGGVRVEILTNHRNTPFQYSRYCDRAHFTEAARDDEYRVDEVRAIVESRDIDIILPIGVMGHKLVLNNGERLPRGIAGAIMPDATKFRIANNKAALFKLAQEVGVSTPPAWVWPDDMSEQMFGSIQYPVLLKPLESMGGLGILEFGEAQSLRAYLDGTTERYLVQEYIAGTQLGLNVLCRGGEILAHTVQQGVIQSAQKFGPSVAVRFIDDAEVLEAGRTMLRALEWNGVANLDFVRCDNTGRVMLLEMNPRYWRTLRGSTLAGVNFPYMACCQALGRSWPQIEKRLLTYAEGNVALGQLANPLAGGQLKGVRLRDTGIWATVTDPMPSLLGRIRR